MPTVADVEQNASHSRARVSCEAPIARRGNERNRFRPKEAEPPLRVLGGYIAPTGRTSALDLNDGVIAFEFPTGKYLETAVESP